MMTRVGLIIAALGMAIAFPVAAQSPAPAEQSRAPMTPPPHAPDPVVTAYQLGLQTGQQISTVVADAKEKLEWWGRCVTDDACVARERSKIAAEKKPLTPAAETNIK